MIPSSGTVKPKFFSVRNLPVYVDSLLLLIRVVCGVAFLLHGWEKIQNPIGWMASLTSVPYLFQALAAISEFGGGISLLLGLLTRLGALGIGCTMLVAIGMHILVFHDPFVNPAGGRSYEQAVSYLLFIVLLLVLGPGRFSLDRAIFGVAPREHRLYY